jgi:hypothetical protein
MKQQNKQMKQKRRNSPFWIKLANWEYWPSSAYYWPLLPHFTWLTIRTGHPAYFTAANPAIFTGGFGFESKYDTIRQIPHPYRPKTILIQPNMPFSSVLKAMEQADLSFPVILKPDLGYRGFLVQKISTEAALKEQLSRFAIPFLVQELITLPQEFGVFYHRMPGATKGAITSLTLKTFLGVVGDGRSTVQELMEADPRALLQLDRVRQQDPTLLQHVPPKGKRIPLGIVGNHSKGTRFINGNHLIDQQLTDTFDRLSAQLPGIYYGRFDIKCQSLEDLKRGENLKILEINGTCSEPTHIYDQEKGTYFSALRDIARHWSIIRKIAVANHRNGTPYEPVPRMLRVFWDAYRYFKKIEKAQRSAGFIPPTEGVE